MTDEIDLYGEFDAHVWAQEFNRTYPDGPDIDTMIAWFANALMTGYDKAHNDAYTQLRVTDGS